MDNAKVIGLILLALIPIAALAKAIYWFTDTYATEKWVKETFPTEKWVLEQLSLITARMDRVDYLIARGGLNSEEAISEFCEMKKSFNFLAEMLGGGQPHAPQCVQATHTPATPAGKTGMHSFSHLRRDSDSDIRRKDYIDEQLRKAARAKGKAK